MCEVLQSAVQHNHAAYYPNLSAAACVGAAMLLLVQQNWLNLLHVVLTTLQYTSTSRS
jgi:hypothetical protein